MTMQQLATAGILIAMGYVIGQDGRRQMVVAPALEDGRTPYLPELSNGDRRGFANIGSGVVQAKGVSQIQGIQGVQAFEPINETLEEDLTAPDTSTTYNLTKLLDVRTADRAMIYLNSTYNQAVSVQVVGHISNDPTDTVGRIDLGSSISVAAIGKVGFSVNLDHYPYPYIGLTITTGSTAPTSGRALVRAFGVRWVNVEQQGTVV